METIDKIFAWLLKGSVKGKLALVASFLLFLKMLYDLFGLENISKSFYDAGMDIATDVLIGELIPIDIGTILMGILTVMLASFGVKHTSEWIKLGKIAKWGAIIIMALSFTPVPAGLSMATAMIAQTDANIRAQDTQKNYAEFSKYVDISKYIILTEGGKKSDIKTILEDNIKTVDGMQVVNITTQEDHGYIRAVLEVDGVEGKKKIEYYIEVVEEDYPEAYYQMKYNGITAYPCSEELDFAYSFEFGNYEVGYATMIERSNANVDILYATAKAEDGRNYSYQILFDSTSMYRSFAPSLAAQKPTEITALPEYCKEMVYEACNYMPKRGTQTIETSETIVVNGITMQKTTGTLSGEVYGGNGKTESYQYIGYYFLVEEDGETYPAVMLGIADEAIIHELEEYMNQAVEHIKEETN